MEKQSLSEKKTCDTCGGTGQISFFQGVSRFLLTSEECPACSGFGYTVDPEDQGHEPAAAPEGDKGADSSDPG